MYGFGSDNEIWTSVGHPIGDLLIEMGCELHEGNTHHHELMRRANEILTKTDWENIHTPVKESEVRVDDGDAFRKDALLKAGQLAIAARAILMARATQFGDAIKQLDKVLSDYDNFIMSGLKKK